MIRSLFNDDWEYTEGSTFFGILRTPTQPVTLPHDASIGKPRRSDYPSGPGGAYAWNGVVTYRKRFHAPAGWQGQRVQLELDGVMMHAEVMLNGHLLAQHPYGYTSFLVDLTPRLRAGAENELIVTANNSAQPNSRWYTGTGIYRHVWLRRGGAVHIPPWGVFVTTPEVATAASTVALATELTNTTGASATALLRSTVVDPDGAVAARGETTVAIEANGTATAHQRLRVMDARLWSVETPQLYTLHSELLLDGAEVDSATTRFGIRSLSVDPANGFRLNGVPLKLKGGCVHHDLGLLGAASYDRAEERKIELLKSAGFNALRSAHNPPSPALLDACDRLGLLVIDESFDMWRMGKTANDYHLFFEDWWQRDTEAMVRRDRNHPSVIMWSVGNEVVETTGRSEAYVWSRRQADLVRSLDPTRPVTQGLRILFEESLAQAQQDPDDMLAAMDAPPPIDPANDRWGSVTEALIAPLDVAGYNYQPHRYAYDSTRFPDRIICATESYPHHAFAAWEAAMRHPTVIGDFVWTAVDYLGESGIGQVVVDAPLMTFFTPYPYHLANCGDFDICGFKRPQSVFRDILWGVRSAPAVFVLDPQHFGKRIRFTPWGWEPVIDSWTFPGREGATTRVDVYCAAEEVELRLNGSAIGRKPAGAAQQNKASFEVVYAPGTLEAVAYNSGQEAGRAALATAGEPAALRLSADRATIAAASGDLSFVTVEVVDAQGTPVRHAAAQVTIEVTGAGELLAVGSADPRSEELYVGTQRAAFEGRLMAVVRSTGQAGEMRVRASAEGMNPGETFLTAYR